MTKNPGFRAANRASPISIDIRTSASVQTLSDLLIIMADDQSKYDEQDDVPYESWDKLDFSIITMGIKKLPFFKDDL